MGFESIEQNGKKIVIVSSSENLITDTQSALDLLATVNYDTKVAIYGDYSKYTSKPLKDFIYESNEGNDFYFVSTKEEAIERLANSR